MRIGHFSKVMPVVYKTEEEKERESREWIEHFWLHVNAREFWNLLVAIFDDGKNQALIIVPKHREEEYKALINEWYGYATDPYCEDVEASSVGFDEHILNMTLYMENVYNFSVVYAGYIQAKSTQRLFDPFIPYDSKK